MPKEAASAGPVCHELIDMLGAHHCRSNERTFSGAMTSAAAGRLGAMRSDRSLPASHDVIVVGAGPAGSAAALAVLQARPSTRVALVDAAAFPRDKACGDGIAPQALHVLAELGVPDAARGFAPVGRLRLRSPLGREVVAEPREPAYCIPRVVFDARLVDAAVARGAELIKRRVRTLTYAGELVELGDGLRAPVVVAADGANSTLRRLLGLPSNPRNCSAVAMRGYAVGDADTAGGRSS